MTDIITEDKLKLQNAYCNLRIILMEDLPLLLKWRNMKHVVDELEDKDFILWNDIFRWFYQIEAKDYLYYIIETPEKTPIGIIYITDTNKKNNAEMIYYIGDSRYLDSNIQKEALGLVLDFAFKRQNINEILFRVHSQNKNRLSLAKEIGFEITNSEVNQNGFITLSINDKKLK